MSSIIYSSGRVVTSSYDGASRTLTVYAGSENYVSSITYAPHGASSAFTFGNSQGPQTRTLNYDSLSRLAYSINPESGTMNYDYDNDGNLVWQNNNGRETCYHPDVVKLIRVKSGSNLVRVKSGSGQRPLPPLTD